MQHSYVDMQEDCNRSIIKKILENFEYCPYVTSSMVDATYLLFVATFTTFWRLIEKKQGLVNFEFTACFYSIFCSLDFCNKIKDETL